MKGTRLWGKVCGFSAVTLQTSLSLDECHNRLARAVDVEKLSFSLSGYAGTKPVLGKIRGDSFRLQKRISYRNDCRPFFYGRFVPSEGGTLIEGKFRMQPCAEMVHGLLVLAPRVLSGFRARQSSDRASSASGNHWVHCGRSWHDGSWCGPREVQLVAVPETRGNHCWFSQRHVWISSGQRKARGIGFREGRQERDS